MSEWLFFGGAVVIWDVGNIMMMMNGCSLVGTGGIWDVGNIIMMLFREWPPGGRVTSCESSYTYSYIYVVGIC